MKSWLKKFIKQSLSTSPDCSGYPATSAGKSLGVRSNSGKRDKAPKNK